MRGIRHIIFDFDDTLVDYTFGNRCAMQKMFDYICARNPGVSMERLTRAFADAKQRCYDTFDRMFARHDKLLQLKMCCNILGIHNPSDILEYYGIYKDTYLKNVRLCPYVIEVLSTCKEKGVHVIVMTNNTLQIQLEVAKKLNIERYIDQFYTSNEFLLEKPDVASMEHILGTIPPEEHGRTIVVGDSKSDMDWAATRGITGIMCDRANTLQIVLDIITTN